MALVTQVTQGLVGSGVTTFVIDASTDMCAFRWEAATTTPVKKIQVRCTAKTGTPHDLQVVMAADTAGIPTISGGIPTDIGGGSPTLVSIAASSITAAATLTVTFTNAYTPTAGTVYWFVLYPGTTGGSAYGASHNLTFLLSSSFLYGTEVPEFAADSTDTGTTWTYRTGVISLSVQDASDNYLPTMMAAVIGATPAAVTYQLSSNPDEYGTLFTVPANETIGLWGLHYQYQLSSASLSDHVLFAYTDPLGTPALLESITVTVANYRPNTTAVAVIRRFLTTHTLTGGTVCGLGMRGTGTSNLNLGRIIYHSQAARDAAVLLTSYSGITREGGSGAYTAQVTHQHAIFPIFSTLGTAGGTTRGDGTGMYRHVTHRG